MTRLATAASAALAAWRLGWHDAWRSLAFERSRAPRPQAALQAWQAGQAARRQRARRLDAPALHRLLQAEAACAAAGLAYPREDAGQQAPWHLPERLAALAATGLPPHPLIAPALLAALVGPPAQQPGSACDALRALLAGADALPARWQGLPVGLAARPAQPARHAVCLHLFYAEQWPAFVAALRRLPQPVDLYVTLPAFAATPELRRLVQAHPRTVLLPTPNRGRDVLPWLQALRAGAFDGYTAVCKLHTKRSPHHADGQRWRDELVQALLPDDKKALQALLGTFEDDPSLGLAGPGAHCIEPGDRQHGGSNQRALARVLPRLGGAAGPDAGQRPFFAGTMFWFRPRALAGLRAAPLSADDFEPEMAQTDGTTAHAIERLVWPLVEHAGYRVTRLPA